MASAAFDVVIVGGGPGGSVCAARLARQGFSVLVLEKEKFPRFHLGESLLPGSLGVLDDIGVLPVLEETFIQKYGARFHDDRDGRKDRFAFELAWRPERDHAFEVPRDRFDQLLLDHARSCGAEIRERWTVTGLVHEDGRAGGVTALSPEGESVRVGARFVVDASGRDALTAHDARTTSKIEGLEQTALFAHFEDVPRAEGKLAGDIDIVLFRAEGSSRPNWFWFIPFKDGRTSVGAVVSREWLRAQRASVSKDEDAQTALFRAAVSSSSTARELLAPARMLWPRAQAAADFSYRVSTLSGPGWLAIGDAAGFIDPLFSTGAHLAMVSAHDAADVIARVLAAPSSEAELTGAWASRLRTGAETFILAVQAFYAGPLVELLFAEDKHAALRRSITSLLAGDVFSDAIWLRDARARLKAMLPSS